MSLGESEGKGEQGEHVIDEPKQQPTGENVQSGFEEKKTLPETKIWNPQGKQTEASNKFLIRQNSLQKL